jgi:hypothetical protein
VIAQFGHADERAAAGLFHVIRMRGNGKDVERTQILERLIWISHLFDKKSLVDKTAAGLPEDPRQYCPGNESAHVREPRNALCLRDIAHRAKPAQ